MKEQYEVSEQREQVESVLERLLSPQPTVVGIEGGPCAGKTTVIEQIRVDAEAQRVPCIVVPEVATEFIDQLTSQGISLPDLMVHDRPAYLEFQVAVVREIQKRIDDARAAMAGIDGRIIVDRTTTRPYVTKGEYTKILQAAGIEGHDPLYLADKIIYLPSLARMDADKYDAVRYSNAARYETAGEAQTTCRDTLRAVASHPELHVIANPGDFDRSVQRASRLALGTAEIEQKWRPSDLPYGESKGMFAMINEKAARGEFLEVADIDQSYHHLLGLDFRLRHMWPYSAAEAYQFTVKTSSSEGREEITRFITKTEYDQLRTASRSVGMLKKTRFHFLHKWQVWSADYLPDMPKSKQWFLEAEVSDRSELQNIATDFTSMEKTDISMSELAQTLDPRIS